MSVEIKTQEEEPPNPDGGVGATDYQTSYAANQNSAWAYLRSLSLKARMDFLTTLYNKGFGSSSKPTGSGLEGDDIARATSFIAFYTAESVANGKQGGFKNQDEAYEAIKKWKTQGRSTASTYTNKLDVASLFTQVAQRDLGRAPTDKEVAAFQAAYRSMEAGGNAPNIQSAAESQLATQNTAEVEATSFADYATAFQDMLRGA